MISLYFSESICRILHSFKGAIARGHLFLKIVVVERMLKDRKGDYVLHMSELTGGSIFRLCRMFQAPSVLSQSEWVFTGKISAGSLL